MKLFSLLPKRLIHLACNSPGRRATFRPATTPGRAAPIDGLPRRRGSGHRQRAASALAMMTKPAWMTFQELTCMDSPAVRLA